MDYNSMLTEEEKLEVKTEASDREWGFSPEEIREVFKRWKDGDQKEKAKVLYLLEECNYHTLCGLLKKGDKAGAVAWMDAEMPLDQTPPFYELFGVHDNWFRSLVNDECIHQCIIDCSDIVVGAEGELYLAICLRVTQVNVGNGDADVVCFPMIRCTTKNMLELRRALKGEASYNLSVVKSLMKEGMSIKCGFIRCEDGTEMIRVHGEYGIAEIK